MQKPRKSFWQIWNMSFGFLGIQFGFGLQLANMSAIYEVLGATPDRLPLVGTLAVMPELSTLGGRPWPDQVRKVPRLRDEHSGLHVIGGLGSRGITWAALAGRLLAHWITGAPCPVDLALRDAMDPARWATRKDAPQAPSAS